MSHERLREALGAYTLGALEPAERAQVDAHLGACQPCRDELAGFAALPGLLSRLSEEEARSGLAASDARTAERVVVAIAEERRAARRRVRRWQLLAAAALAGIAVLLLPLVGPGADATLVPRAEAADAAGIAGALHVTDRAWGMTVELDLRGLPVRDGYSLVAVTEDDHRAVAASWSGTGQDRVTLTGSCYVSRDRLHRVEVVTPDGEVLVVFEA